MVSAINWPRNECIVTETKNLLYDNLQIKKKTGVQISMINITLITAMKTNEYCL